MDISYLKVAASDVYQPTNFREKEGKKKKKMKEKRKQTFQDLLCELYFPGIWINIV